MRLPPGTRGAAPLPSDRLPRDWCGVRAFFLRGSPRLSAPPVGNSHSTDMLCARYVLRPLVPWPKNQTPPPPWRAHDLNVFVFDRNDGWGVPSLSESNHLSLRCVLKPALSPLASGLTGYNHVTDVPPEQPTVPMSGS